MAAIDDFKANLIGGGARANQFRVTITPPPGIAIGLDVRRASFLATASNLPASTLGEIAVPFRGRNIYVSGDRPAPETWTVTFYNDTDFMIRNAMELWQNGINDYVENTGVTSPADYQTDLTVEQLDRDDTVLKTYIFRNAYPLTVAQIDLSSAEATEIETFEVTWRYQHFEPSGVSF
jgi:hypothetical protein|tara:strand:- start:913 stop:1446 length:534 start_codon:yes stop_codon:yes gene_type:complete